LPADGLWHVRTPTDETVVQIYLTPPSEIGRRLQGRRMTAALRQQRIDQGQWKVRMPYQACLSFARAHNATGPAAVAELDTEEHRYVVENLQSYPPWWNWDEAADGELPDGPFVFLVPGAKFHFADAEKQVVPAERRELLAVELRPYVNDGKHWVLYTDGSTVREPIDKTRVERHQLAIRPVVNVGEEDAQAAQPTLTYTLVAVRNGSMAKPFEVRVFNSISGDEQQRTWTPANAPQDEKVLSALSDARRFAWQPYLRTGPAPTLRTWLASPDAVDPNETPGAGDNLTAFSLLGGRAAIEETLQMQNLRPVGRAEGATIEVSSLTGVEVQSHPFAEMLGGQPGGQLSLANAVPPDRFFVYVAKPEAILPFLDKGAGFAAAAGAGWTGNRLDYDLTRRYLQRLGISRSWLEAVLKSGVLQDMAVVLPDLLLIDGTDITVVARLKQPELLAALLPLAGIQGLTPDGVSTVKTSGRETSWALRGDLLCISSHRSELDSVLRLIAADGVGSLGRSDEFRYMLTQVPVKPQTRMLAYFSDSFVRRIVGPEVKLGQLRRVQARAQMELLTSQSLLARLDGVSPVDSVADLIRMKYLPAGFPAEGYSIDAEGLVRSAVYGSLDDMKTLQEVPVERVTPAEADVYKRYVENYSRYWRQFFDPIAIRLDDAPDRSLELTTFILPLIDNTIYNRLREMTLRHEDRKPLVIPRIEPSPVLQFSVNLDEEFWQETAGNFSDFFRRFGGASPALLDDLGPALHLAVFDADPVIALGSGDAMGAFGGNVLGGGNDMLFLAPALSLLTRPCTILIETRDPEQTARYLRQAANVWTAGADRGSDDFRVSFYQVDGRDSWVWTMNFAGVIKLRFGVEVADRYLVIRNIPWSVQDRVVRTDTAALNTAGLSVWPAASRLELPGIVRQRRRSGAARGHVGRGATGSADPERRGRRRIRRAAARATVRLPPAPSAGRPVDLAGREPDQFGLRIRLAPASAGLRSRAAVRVDAVGRVDATEHAVRRRRAAQHHPLETARRAVIGILTNSATTNEFSRIRPRPTNSATTEILEKISLALLTPHRPSVLCN
jgi:hypothetical protein